MRKELNGDLGHKLWETAVTNLGQLSYNHKQKKTTTTTTTLREKEVTIHSCYDMLLKISSVQTKKILRYAKNKKQKQESVT